MLPHLQGTCILEADSHQADKLQSLIKAANITEVEPIWTSLYAKVRMFFISMEIKMV